MSVVWTDKQRELLQLLDPEDNWTEEQAQSIVMLDSNVIVSASAGCGKTKAMVERAYVILRTGTPVTKLTMLTFTEAAAAEMKDRLRKRLMKAAKKETDATVREHLVKQIDQMPYANISTIHGYCYKLVREYFEQIPLSPSVKILEEDAADELKRKAFEQLLRAKEGDKDFDKMRFTIGLRDDHDLYEILNDIYERMTNQPEREYWLKRTFDEMYRCTFEESVAAVYFKEKIARATRELLVEALELKKNAVGDAKYDLVEVLCRRLGYYEQAYSVADMMAAYYKADDGVSINAKGSAFKNEITLLNAKYTKYIKDELAKIAELGEYRRIEEMHRESAPFVEMLFALVLEFETAYTKQKADEGCVDFADLERYAIKILLDTNIREEIRARNDYVFVDEFQDTNLVQSTIIAEITPAERLYVVGDSKQCIYRFREAEPQIFLDRLQMLKDEGKSVTYADNFRSDNRILDVVNRVFGTLMTKRFGGVDYKETDAFRLRPAMSDNEAAVRHYFYDKKPDSKETAGGTYSVKKAVLAEKETDNEEGKAIASFIREHLGERIVEVKTKGKSELRELTYGDVAILVAKRKAAERVIPTLLALGVPLNLDTFAGDTGLRDVNVLLAFADLMDNGMQDYPLLTVLKSPFGGFCDGDLAAIRMAGEKYTPFYQAFAEYAEGEGELAQRAKAFLDKVRETAFAASFTPLPTLFRRCLIEWGYADYLFAQQDGLERMAALQYFIAGLEGKGYAVDLASMCAHFRAFPMEELASVSVDGSADRVMVSTMHASKGLEYPMVILPALDSSKGGRKSAVKLDKTLGVGTDYYDAKTRTRCNTFAKTVIKMKKGQEEREDRLRLLYVAMTRAKNYLFMSGAKNKEAAKLADTTGNYVDWALLAMAEDTALSDYAWDGGTTTWTAAAKSKETLPLGDNLDEVLAAKYPYPEATTLEKKYTVTALNARRHKDEAPEPNYLGDREEMGLGTVYHTVFQYIDYRKERAEEVEQELKRLVEEGILSQEEIANVDAEVVSRCLRLDVLRKSLSPDVRAYHELRFVLSEQASALGLASDEKVLVQGVIDLLLVEEDGLTVIDFKLSNRRAAALREAYKVQLDLYCKAAEQAYKRKVKRRVLVKIVNAEVVEC